MAALWHNLLLFLCPAYCTACKELLAVRTALCSNCLQQVKPVVSIKVTITQKYHMQVHAVGAYQDPLKQLILAKSYQDKLACYYIAELIFNHMRSIGMSADYLVPVPLHWTRYAKRGYNQSYEIAKYLSRWSNIPIVHALRRVKCTDFQAKHNKVGRKQNVQGAFTITNNVADKVRYKNLLLVDDVMTTGATLREAGRTMLVFKPLSLKAIALARTIQD